MDQEPVLTLTWPAVAGSGFVATLLFLALVERLRRTFATRAEVEALREQLARPQERMADKLAAVGEEQAAQAAALGHALQRLDRLDAAPAAPVARARRRG